MSSCNETGLFHKTLQQQSKIFRNVQYIDNSLFSVKFLAWI